MGAKDLEIFDEMPFLFWVKDEEEKYSWGDRTISQLAGENVVGKTDHELVWSESADVLRAAGRQVFELGKPSYLREFSEEHKNE